jgi:hypothetical protein
VASSAFGIIESRTSPNAKFVHQPMLGEELELSVPPGRDTMKFRRVELKKTRSCIYVAKSFHTQDIILG